MESQSSLSSDGFLAQAEYTDTVLSTKVVEGSPFD